MLGLRHLGERLAAIERMMRKLEEGERARAADLDGTLTQLAGRIERQPTAKDLRELRIAVRALAPRDDREALEEIGRIATSGLPIVVGPWTGELGFELLYWIPFVEWVRAHWNVPPARLLVVSRGGVGSWYRVEDARYADVFSFVSPDRFRVAIGEEKRKQRRRSPFDREILDQVRQRCGLTDFEWLHPGVMYRLFAPFWSDEAGYARIEQFTRYRCIEPAEDLENDEKPARRQAASLPADYIAVRFYFSECFPDTDDNRAFARSTVLALAERHPVVLLNPGFSVDEHEDWTASAADRVRTIADRLPPEQNLAIQADVIRGARAFVGTYGGYSYLAPMCRVPALAFYSRPMFKIHHRYAAERAFAQMGAAPLTLLDVSASPLAQSALAGAAAAVR